MITIKFPLPDSKTVNAETARLITNHQVQRCWLECLALNVGSSEEIVYPFFTKVALLDLWAATYNGN